MLSGLAQQGLSTLLSCRTVRPLGTREGQVMPEGERSQREFSKRLLWGRSRMNRLEVTEGLQVWKWREPGNAGLPRASPVQLLNNINAH